MKKLVLTLALLAGVVAGAQDIGIYPSTTWASTNLLINRALETGQVGQVIGYVSNGVVGPIAGGGGTGQTYTGNDGDVLGFLVDGTTVEVIPWYGFVSVGANDTLPSTYQVLYVQAGNAIGITNNATPPIAAGRTGQRLLLMGAGAVNYTLINRDNLKMNVTKRTLDNAPTSGEQFSLDLVFVSGVWREIGADGLSVGTTGGLSQTNVFIPDNSYRFPITFDYVYFTYGMAPIQLTNNNVFADGVDGQVITLMNNNNSGDPYHVAIEDDTDGTDDVGSNVDAGASAITMLGKRFYTFTFSSSSSLWVLNGVGQELFPAPWPPPDANGIQQLPSNIKDRLVIELLPWMLREYPRLFPAGVPGTATNPIVVP